MKQILISLCLAAALLSPLSGCSSGNHDAGDSTATLPVDSHSDILYSNLADPEAQTEVEALLSAAEMDPDSIASFLSIVQDYNSLVGSQPYFHDGFTPLPEGGVDYDAQDTYTLWMDQRDYADANCRITAYSLLRDLISAGSPMAEGLFLAMDSDALDNHPLLSLSEAERGVFGALFDPVSVPPTTDAAVVQNAMLNEWKARGITFAEGKATSISVILHSELDNIAYVGHTGVLLPTEEGWLFVEKYSPTYPYQATKFQTREQVSEYLMDRLGTNYTEGVSAKPFILENDHAFV